jgi:hypothetical protein
LEEIYKAYPLKVNKPAALKAIRRALDDTPHETLLAATIAFAKARPAGTPFTKHPATWFNGRCYEDAPSSWCDQSQNPGVPGAPLKGSPEFCPGWRNKHPNEMTSKERVAYCE